MSLPTGKVANSARQLTTTLIIKYANNRYITSAIYGVRQRQRYDILEPAIKEIDIMDFQNETEKECVDVPFTIIGKEKETEENKQKMEISDSFVTSFAIFVIVFGLIMLKICWI